MADPTLEASIREALQCCPEHHGQMPVEPRIDDLAPRLVSLFEKREAALRVTIDSLIKHNERLAAERDAAQAECEEQARLNGMGSEREAKLMAERDRAVRERDEARARCEALVNDWRTHLIAKLRQEANAIRSERDALREAAHGEAMDNVRLRNDLFPLKAALAALVAKVERVVEDVKEPICIATIHGFPYTGAQIEPELSEARAALKENS